MSKDKHKNIFKALKSVPTWIIQIAAVITALGVLAGAVATADAFLLDRATTRLEERIKPIEQDINEIKLDETRLQLLYMLEHRPEDTENILKIAKKYFVDMGGDWYMTAIFDEWCEERGIHREFELPI